MVSTEEEFSSAQILHISAHDSIDGTLKAGHIPANAPKPSELRITFYRGGISRNLDRFLISVLILEFLRGVSKCSVEAIIRVCGDLGPKLQDLLPDN